MRKILLLFVSVALIAGRASAQKGALSRAYGNYKKGDYEDVIALTSRAENYGGPSRSMRAEILFLMAMALEKLGRHSEAQGVLKFISDKFGDTAYGYRAGAKVESGPEDHRKK